MVRFGLRLRLRGIDYHAQIDVEPEPLLEVEADTAIILLFTSQLTVNLSC